MANSIYELAILLSLRDMASGGLGRTEAQLRSLGKEGKATLQTFESLRAGMKKDFMIAGVGVASLALMKKGIDVAGDYESALLDLRSAYQESATAGALSAQEQQAQLKGLGNLAVDLGNKLQGNTKTYVGILTALKQAGLPADQVLGGAGRSAAYLANVSGALSRGQEREQAKELGQFGLMFKLRPEEFETSVNLFSALKDKFDIESSSLIESAKYFQATSNAFGISGAKGAGDTVKFFSLLKRQAGMEGSMAGTGARAFFMQLATEEKKLAQLKKATGIQLRPFDEKGVFRGYEAMFSEMEKFRGLNQQQSAKWLNNIFGERGQEVAGAMVKVGLDGWKNITAESSKAVPVNEKINQQMATYNAKIEALTGSIQNLTASAFLPALDTAKPLVDLLNTGAGALQGWASSHPGIAGVATELIGVGSVAATVIFGIKGATTAIRLWKIASSVSVGQTGQLTFMRALGTQSAATSVQLEGAAKKAGMFRSVLRGIGGLAPIGVAIALEFTITKGLELYQLMQEYKQANEQATSAGTSSLASLSRLKEDYAKRGEQVPKEVYERRASDLVRSAKEQGALSGVGADLAGGQRHLLNPYGIFYREFDFLKQTPELADSGLMRAFLDKIQRSFPQDQVERITKSLEARFPASVKDARAADPQAQALAQQLTGFLPPLQTATDLMASLQLPLMEVPMPLTRIADSAGRAASGLDRFTSRLDGFEMPTIPGAASAPPPGGTPSYNPFPIFKRSSYEAPQPQIKNEVLRAVARSGGERGAASTVHQYGDVHVHIDGQSSDDPRELARLVAQEVQIQIERAG